ncbi:unnamed protein product [Chilo suppressalis]|uniref:dolichol kinase n=1 Tax=Chilo suppressalis TaxID=168631 RepID=A0ABN8AU58_CHISP|nr:unnamed protein product [Chilo suppressalis]
MDQNFFLYVDARCTQIFRTLDSQVLRNTEKAGIQTRPAESNGLWCCALLPIILNIYSVQYAVSPLYKFVSVISIGLFIYCVLFIIFLSMSSLVIQQSVYSGCIASGFISVLLMYTILNCDLLFSLIYSLTSVLSFSWLLRTSLNQFQKTFTIGEAMLLLQAAVLFVAATIAKTTTNLDESDKELDFIYTIIFTVLLTVGIIITALCLLKDEQRNIETLGYIIAGSGAVGLFILHCTLGFNCIYHIIQYIFLEGNRALIFLFWAVLLVIALVVLATRTQLAVKASTVTRKSFHILASLVFMSGILLDPNLMTLAAGIGFAVLLLTEALRKSKIDPISSMLQSAFLVYCDEKDCGSFAMTPLYLFTGLACGLALVPRTAGPAPLERLSGVLATGIGDSAASWFGANYGFNKWPGGHRTYEGTFFNILSQVATVYALLLFELLDVNYALVRTTIAAVISGFVEARTHQVDNMVLPLVTLIAFQATWFLS